MVKEKEYQTITWTNWEQTSGEDQIETYSTSSDGLITRVPCEVIALEDFLGQRNIENFNQSEPIELS